MSRTTLRNVFRSDGTFTAGQHHLSLLSKTVTNHCWKRNLFLCHDSTMFKVWLCLGTNATLFDLRKEHGLGKNGVGLSQQGILVKRVLKSSKQVTVMDSAASTDIMAEEKRLRRGWQKEEEERKFQRKMIKTCPSFSDFKKYIHNKGTCMANLDSDVYEVCTKLQNKKLQFLITMP